MSGHPIKFVYQVVRWECKNQFLWWKCKTRFSIIWHMTYDIYVKYLFDWIILFYFSPRLPSNWKRMIKENINWPSCKSLGFFHLSTIEISYQISTKSQFIFCCLVSDVLDKSFKSLRHSFNVSHLSQNMTRSLNFD